MNILLNWIKTNSNFWIEFSGKKGLSNNFLNWMFPKKFILNNHLNWILLWNEWMNHTLNRYLPFFDEKSPFLSTLDNFWALFLFDQYQLFSDYWIELSFELNQQIFFELNNILYWILGKAILNQILIESYFGKIQTLNWIRWGWGWGGWG